MTALQRFLYPFFRFKEYLNEVEAMIARRRKAQYIEPASEYVYFLGLFLNIVLYSY